MRHRTDLRDSTALVVGAVLLRLPLLGAPPRPDEAGYLLVARHAHGGGPFLYGDLWVDRPPLLVAVYRLADRLGGLAPLRLLGVVAAAVLVVAASDAGRTVGGRRGGQAAGLVALALQATPLLAGPEVDGELLALPLVLLACAVGLRSLGPARRPRARELAVAGLLGGAALLVKQNLADALVLLTVVLVGRVVAGGVGVWRGAALFGALAGGAAVPVAAAVAWAQAWGPGPGRLWQDLVVFRGASLATLAAGSSGRPEERAERLLLAAVLSGVVPLLVLLLLALARRGGPRGVVAAGVLASVAEASASVVLGGSWWTHYLLELVPACALAAALLTRAPARLRRAGQLVVALVVVGALGGVVQAAVAAGGSGCATPEAGAHRVALWLQAHHRPGDTGTVLYGGADDLLGAGLRLPYPYLWSLPVRTLDPRLAGLRATVTGPGRLDWVVIALPPGSWRLDDDGALRRALAAGYTRAATVCGRTVLHRVDGPDGGAVRGTA